ncbi:hypothetical protein CVT25_005181 [Psilocybe cyanescens]|uniref:Uncharacterized protein n=1 Tax=Psilocybe cyanescens TaxID=93625 RepID=A0A409XBU0_PSICY|nr:hypothetical protein CVT25_005181 [Psilocybe cyanescens]
MFGISSADMALSMYYLFRYTLNNLVIPSRYPRMLFFFTNNVFADAILLNYQPRTTLMVSASIRGADISLLHSLVPRKALYRSPDYNPSVLFKPPSQTPPSFYVDDVWSQRLSHITYRYHMYTAKSSCLNADEHRPQEVDYSGLTFLHAGLNQIVGMVPTLIIIRINLGRASLNGPTVLQRAPAGGSSTPVLDSIFSTIGTGAPNTAPQSPRGGGAPLPQELNVTV